MLLLSNSCYLFLDIQFAEAFLGQELGDVPSPAASMVVDEDHSDTVLMHSENAFKGWTWLMEKCCPTTVVRISGTLAHPSISSNLLSLTVMAFAHFAYLHSQKTLVFADLQGKHCPVTIYLVCDISYRCVVSGTHCQVKEGVDGFILFDPMTHTEDGCVLLTSLSLPIFVHALTH